MEKSKYIGAVRSGNHYQKMPSEPMAIQGWIRLIERIGGYPQVDDTTEGVIDLTVTVRDPRDGSPLVTQEWTLIPEGHILWDDVEGEEEE